MPPSRPLRSGRPSRDQPRFRPNVLSPVSHDRPESGTTRMFAITIPGIGRLLRDEIAGTEGLTAGVVGNDGRSDVVLFEAARGFEGSALRLSLAEDVFVEIGRTLRSEGDRAGWITRRIWKPQRVERALSVRSTIVRPLRSAATLRVIVRVLQERSFLRTELRRELTAAVRRDRPRWRIADPAELELWTVEYNPGRFIAGLRLSDERMRQHGGRTEERHGALRPVVAAAMVRLAGDHPGVLLDPCCGSGTILAEAASREWTTIGRDIDPEAIRATKRNIPSAESALGDARRLDLGGGSVDACVSNLPFGRQFQVDKPMDEWLHQVLSELARVTRPGGRIVLLAPHVPRHTVPEELHRVDRVRLRLLGTATSIWVYRRSS
jgi:23S rRNA G2445 N2-methylase RlmL